MNSLLHGRPHFFKYCTADTIKKIIKNRSVKWSSLVIFNDPFDLQTDFRFGFEVEDLKGPFSEELANLVFADEEPTGDINHPLFAMTMWTRKNRDKFSRKKYQGFMKPAADEGKINAVKSMANTQAWWAEFRQKLRVYCVTELHDDILMWAHYADFHTGVVIKHKCIIEQDRAICAAVPVNYEDEVPVIANIDEYVKHLTGQKELDFSNIFTKFATTKSNHWFYEKEWRCIGWDSKNDGTLFEFVNIIPEEVEAIYFGCKVSEKDQLEIHKLISGDFSHVKLFKARKHPKRYELEFTAIN